MTLKTAPWILPNSADAPTDWTCTSWMTSIPGSAMAPPVHGHVKLVPSNRKLFSLTLEPNDDTALLGLNAVTAPDDTVGETPGVALTRSNKLKRRPGIARI